MQNEYRIYGPPGTGKTTTVKKMVEDDIKNYGASCIMVASFSKAAAAELQGRGLKLGKEQIGTLHSICYALHGRPMIAEENPRLWNETYPILAIGKKKVNTDDEDAISTLMDGDKLLSKLNILRGKLARPNDYPADVWDFYKKWTAFKQENNMMDFCDLIEKTYEQDLYPDYAIGYFDEAQDFTPLELKLIRKWGENMKRFVLAGDDDQCIYNFKGCTPDGFVGVSVPPENIKVLNASYRLPIRIQEYADRYIKTVKSRVSKEYSANDKVGSVIRSWLRYTNKTEIINDVQQYLIKGKTVMFITTCSYMLYGVIEELKRNAIPFHNPYRRTQGKWNPLGSRSGISGLERILSFTKSEWTEHDVYVWGDALQAKKTMLPEAKKLLKRFEGKDETFEPRKLERYFTEESILEIENRNVVWYYNNALNERKNGLEYPAKIYLKYGRDKLLEAPKVIVGTIHSVKGGEADVVYLFPDISGTSDKELSIRTEKQDELTRLFYVGMTRARETLILCEPATKYNFKI